MLLVPPILLGLVASGVCVVFYFRLRALRWSVVLLGAAILILFATFAPLLIAIMRAPAKTSNTAASARQSAPSQPPAALQTGQDYMAQGDYEFERGNYDAAITAYTRAIELKPDYPEAYNNRAYAYMTKQDYAPALTDLNHALALRPDYVNALMNRGDIHNYYFDIDYGAAVADYDRIIALGETQDNSVCGHRLLALYHGWTPAIYLDLLKSGGQAGCDVANPG